MRILATFSLFILSIIVHGKDSTSVLFYNVENLFDTEDDSTKNDNEFLPESIKEWDKYKLRKKTKKIAQLIAANNYPDVIGLCEVENKEVVENIAKTRLLYKKHYQVLHFESNDMRGIDVALLFKDDLELLDVKIAPVHLGGRKKTRDILQATFVNHLDTFVVFVNHWPSRWGGIKKSNPNRMIAAKKLKHLMDSTSSNFPNRKLIAMGDFNDEPKDKSLKLLKQYNNLMTHQLIGSLKYKGKWKKFDQFIISKNFEARAYVFKPDFLLEEDVKYSGNKPFRTYYGPRYNGGFSDHLPILLKF